MKKIINGVLATIVTMGLGISLASCSNDNTWQDEKYDVIVQAEDSEVVKAGSLIVAISPDYAPYEFLDNTKVGVAALSGADVYFANYLAQSLGLKLEFLQLDFANIFGSLTTSKADIVISGLTYDASRAENYDLTNQYYVDGEGGQVLICLKDKVSEFTSLSVLNDAKYTVSAQSGSIQYNLVSEQLPNAKMDEIGAITDGVTKLISGRVDAMAISELAAEALISQRDDIAIIPNVAFEIEDSGLVACLNKNSALTAKVNQVISKLGDGVYSNWFDISKKLVEELGLE